jgi:hypothetical protein
MRLVPDGEADQVALAGALDLRRHADVGDVVAVHEGGASVQGPLPLGGLVAVGESLDHELGVGAVLVVLADPAGLGDGREQVGVADRLFPYSPGRRRSTWHRSPPVLP